jgi:Cu/Ag efflux pump CusA
MGPRRLGRRLLNRRRLLDDPLAKTLAITFSSILAITVVPILMALLILGRRLRPEGANPVARFFQVNSRS